MVDLATGAVLAKLAFDEFVKAGAGEVAKQSVGSAIELVKNLRGKIQAKFRGDERAQKAIQAVEQEGSQPALTKLGVYLEDAMEEDESFANEIRQVAQQLINIQNQTSQGNRIYNQTVGRDVFNIDRVEGDSNKFGGS